MPIGDNSNVVVTRCIVAMYVTGVECLQTILIQKQNGTINFSIASSVLYITENLAQ